MDYVFVFSLRIQDWFKIDLLTRQLGLGGNQGGGGAWWGQSPGVGPESCVYINTYIYIYRYIPV